MLYEIRNYHIKPEKFEEWKKWIRETGLPFIKSKMDLVGFWLKNDMTPEIRSSIEEEALGPSNVTWIVRWQSKEQRDKTWQDFRGSDEWQHIFSMVPGGRDTYLRTEAKFAEAI